MRIARPARGKWIGVSFHVLARLRQFASTATRMERKTVCAIKGVSSNELAGQNAGYHFHAS